MSAARAELYIEFCDNLSQSDTSRWSVCDATMIAVQNDQDSMACTNDATDWTVQFSKVKVRLVELQ